MVHIKEIDACKIVTKVGEPIDGVRESRSQGLCFTKTMKYQFYFKNRTRLWPGSMIFPLEKQKAKNKNKRKLGGSPAVVGTGFHTLYLTMSINH